MRANFRAGFKFYMYSGEFVGEMYEASASLLYISLVRVSLRNTTAMVSSKSNKARGRFQLLNGQFRSISLQTDRHWIPVTFLEHFIPLKRYIYPLQNPLKDISYIYIFKRGFEHRNISENVQIMLLLLLQRSEIKGFLRCRLTGVPEKQTLSTGSVHGEKCIR